MEREREREREAKCSILMFSLLVFNERSVMARDNRIKA